MYVLSRVRGDCRLNCTGLATSWGKTNISLIVIIIVKQGMQESRKPILPYLHSTLNTEKELGRIRDGQYVIVLDQKKNPLRKNMSLWENNKLLLMR